MKRETSNPSGVPSGTSGYHRPVLLEECVRLLLPAPGKLFLDGTLGGGGHTLAFAEAGARVIALDHDLDAIAYAGARLEQLGEKVRIVHANFKDAGDVLDELGIKKIDGALLDLGVSSYQIDTAERGFSFQADGPLDMRMDSTNECTAEKWINETDETEMARVFYEYGEESASRRIASAIIKARAKTKIRRTLELASIVEKVLPRRGAKRHPATKTFQAIRIAVNSELESLREGVEALLRRLAPGGRLGVISFHSLEDRYVKQRFKLGATEWLDAKDWPSPRRNPDYQLSLVSSKAIQPTEEEAKANPRSRSAKLRVVEKLTYVQQSPQK